MMTIDSNKLTK